MTIGHGLQLDMGYKHNFLSFSMLGIVSIILSFTHFTRLCGGGGGRGRSPSGARQAAAPPYAAELRRRLPISLAVRFAEQIGKESMQAGRQTARSPDQSLSQVEINRDNAPRNAGVA